MTDPVASELGKLYRKWAELEKVVRDRSRPPAERLAALHQIEDEMGVPRTPDNQLEAETDRLIASYQ